MHPSTRNRWGDTSSLRARRVLLLLTLALPLVLYGLRTLWLPPLGAFLVVQDPLEPAEAVLSLAGDLERPGYAADLFRRGYAREFLITRLPLDTPEARADYLEQVSEIAVRGGVPEEAIRVVPGVAYTTYEEALNVRLYAQERGLSSLLVVTSPWHTRRSRLNLRAAFRETGLSVSVQPAGRLERDWWRTPSGLRAVGSEYLKLTLYPLGVR